ncbi:MAG: drug/metabolite transporter (DMT)-like permease [Candidatus Latescibacterota bacterium]|jgi:drug/metabolite transporter (DMT)-like permease
MNRLPDHTKGLIVSLAGIVVLSPDSLLVRLINTDPWTLLFWRGLLMAIGVSIGLIANYRHHVLKAFFHIGRSGLLASALMGIGTILFVQALSRTSVANVFIIIGIGPLFAALLGRAFLKETVHLRTWLAIGGALIGIWIAVVDDGQSGRLVGDLCAAAAALCHAGYLTLLRSAQDVDMTPTVVVGGAFVAVAVWVPAAPLSLTPEDAAYSLLLGLFILPVSLALIAIGPRYLPAPEVNLVMLLEMVLGPYWVWLVLDEEPGQRAVVGGVIVLTVLLLHSVASLRAQSAKL